MYFQSILSQKVPTTIIEDDTERASNSFQSLLQALGLSEYYPQKLTHVDVIKVTEEALKNDNRKPSSLKELPWNFIRQMLALNSTVRETGSTVEMESKSGKEFEESDSYSDSDYTDTSDEESKEVEKMKEAIDEEQTTENGIHPLDLIYTVFMCADDFLRQELADKMSKCQYAVPFILPSPSENRDESQNQILRWSLQTICKTYCEGNKPESSVTKTMVNVQCPLVSCLHLGDTVPGKSKILNEMLGRNLNNF